MRFSLFKFKVNEQVRRPAWDFQYVIHRVETGKQYGFRGRLVWKKFVSDEDCLQEYETWAAALPAQSTTDRHFPSCRADGCAPANPPRSDTAARVRAAVGNSRPSAPSRGQIRG